MAGNEEMRRERLLVLSRLDRSKAEEEGTGCCKAKRKEELKWETRVDEMNRDCLLPIFSNRE